MPHLGRDRRLHLGDPPSCTRSQLGEVVKMIRKTRRRMTHLGRFRRLLLGDHPSCTRSQLGEVVKMIWKTRGRMTNLGRVWIGDIGLLSG